MIHINDAAVVGIDPNFPIFHGFVVTVVATVRLQIVDREYIHSRIVQVADQNTGFRQFTNEFARFHKRLKTVWLLSVDHAGVVHQVIRDKADIFFFEPVSGHQRIDDFRLFGIGVDGTVCIKACPQLQLFRGNILCNSGEWPQRFISRRQGKIMDAGALEAETAFQAGADYVTVLGVTDNLTIAEVVDVAHRMQKKVMVDMICVADLQNRLKTMEDLGVDVIAVHTGVDQQKQGRTPLDDLREMRAQVSHTPLAVAGGINAASLPAYLAYDPHIVIIGGGIAHAADPVAAAKQLKAILDQHNKEA